MSPASTSSLMLDVCKCEISKLLIAAVIKELDVVTVWSTTTDCK